MPPTRQATTRESFSLLLSRDASECLIEKPNGISLREGNTIDQRRIVRKAAIDPSWNANWEACLVAPRRDIPIYTEVEREREKNREKKSLRRGAERVVRQIGRGRRKYVAAAQHVARNLATSRRGRRLTFWSKASYRDGITTRISDSKRNERRILVECDYRREDPRREGEGCDCEERFIYTEQFSNNIARKNGSSCTTCVTWLQFDGARCCPIFRGEFNLSAIDGRMSGRRVSSRIINY